MSYVKTTWETGDVVTAEKLNNIEDEVDTLSKEEKIPDFSSSDNNKVLTVKVVDSTPNLEWAEAGGSSLPSITGNANKFLKVKSNASDVEWANVREVPNPSFNVGKYLIVDSSGNATWDDVPYINIPLSKTNNTWSVDATEIGGSAGINDICNYLGYYRECSVYASYTYIVNDNEYTDIMKAFSITSYQDTTTYEYHLVGRFIPVFTGNSMPIITVDAYFDYDSGNNVATLTVKNVTLS